MSWDRHPYLRKYAIKYLCSVCVLAHCTPRKRTPGFGTTLGAPSPNYKSNVKKPQHTKDRHTPASAHNFLGRLCELDESLTEQGTKRSRRGLTPDVKALPEAGSQQASASRCALASSERLW